MRGALWSKIQEFLSKEIRKQHLKPADHVFTWRPGNSKAHHGIYDADDEKVIHLAPKVAGQEYRQLLSTSIDDFLDGGKLYLFEYGVDPAIFLAIPTCALIGTDRPEVVKHRASFLLQKGFRVHHLCKDKSEDFAVYCKTGLLSIRVSRRDQAAPLLAIACAFFLLKLNIFTPANLIRWSVTGLVVYFIYRLASDIGARPDVSNRVAVEELAEAEVKELPFVRTLMAWIVLVISILFYTVTQTLQRNMLFWGGLLQGDFNFRNLELSNKIRVDQLQPGDHIYTWRGFVYTHHGIYAGNGEVIHTVRGLDPILQFSTSFYSSNSSVQSVSIDEFVCGGQLYRYEYGVNLGFFLANIHGGACTMASSDPPVDVVRRARFLLHHKAKGMKGNKYTLIFGAYNLLTNNCEDFAIYCKTSLVAKDLNSVVRSGQVARFYAVVSGIQTWSHPSLNSIRVAAGFCICSAVRMISDTKRRWDGLRIPVEQLADSEELVALGLKETLFVYVKLVILGTLLCLDARCMLLDFFGKSCGKGYCEKLPHWVGRYFVVLLSTL